MTGEVRMPEASSLGVRTEQVTLITTLLDANLYPTTELISLFLIKEPQD